MKREIRSFLFVILLAGTACAQTWQSRSATQAPDPADPGVYGWMYRAGLACGAGASETTTVVKPTAQCGGSFTLFPFVEFEAGAMGPQASRSAASGYFSTNFSLPLAHPHKRVFPLVVGGYTRMFETGNALDYGVAFARTIDSYHTIQFEVRDYWAYASPNQPTSLGQHNVIFRVAWLIGLPD